VVDSTPDTRRIMKSIQQNHSFRLHFLILQPSLDLPHDTFSDVSLPFALSLYLW